MKLLLLSDQEEPYLWDFYKPGMLADYDLILAAGDLKAVYLEFLVTMARCPLLYVRGNHDQLYDTQPPEGCDQVDDQLVTINGLRILGLGGCMRYSGSAWQFTEEEMARRIRKLRRKLKKAGGVDIVLTHAPPLGCGDGEDLCHRGFACFRDLIEEYQPRYFIHGHQHLNYKTGSQRVRMLGSTTVINACGRYELNF